MRCVDAFNRLPQIIRFGFVGCAGFCIDTSVLYLALYALGVHYYTGRVISYAVAATSTWYMNRRFTFADTRHDNRFREWRRFVMLNLFGGGINYAVYAAYISMHTGSSAGPAIGVALGSIAGMSFNFFLSKRLVFNRRRAIDLTELR